MSVGKSSELRAQIVSDEWLTKLGKNWHRKSHNQGGQSPW